MSENYVLTPGGFKPADRVHHVAGGHSLNMRGELAELHHRERGLVATFGAIEPHRTDQPLLPANVAPQPPGGGDSALLALRRQDFESNDLIGRALDDLELAKGGGAFPEVSGWISYAGWSNGSGAPISRLASTWTVPPEPSRRGGQTVFLFNGIQNSTMIYQPVLQWGPSAAGGGPKWSVACWYADSQQGHSFYSDLVDVSVGDRLVGVMTLTGSGNGLCSYVAEFVGIANTRLPIVDVEELTWANETLEAYGISSRADFPATRKTDFTAIALETGGAEPGLQWAELNDHPETGSKVRVADGSSANGHVEIWYEPE